MNEPLLHKRTEALLRMYQRSPMHALLLTGSDGVGKYYIAQWLAKQLVSTTRTVEVELKKSTISIDQIRELYQATRTGNDQTVIIKDAHRLSKEAQNAFLKLLEEPPKNTRFILTSNHAGSLLSTIRSRSQLIEILPPSKQQLRHYAQQNNFTSTSVDSLIYSSQQLPGIFVQALNNDAFQTTHTDMITEAKYFYTSTQYQRHINAITHNYDLLWIEPLLNTLSLIVSTLRKSTQDSSRVKTLNAQTRLIERTSQSIKQNGNPKIHITKLIVQL